VALDAVNIIELMQKSIDTPAGAVYNVVKLSIPVAEYLVSVPPPSLPGIPNVYELTAFETLMDPATLLYTNGCGSNVSYLTFALAPEPLVI
jgi:hypothetical protein